jgi:hypothetical protein
MTSQASNDQLLNNIIVFGFSIAFGLVIASLQALKRTPSGFAIQLSGWTLVALLIGAAVMVPCFRLIVFSQRRYLRRAALAFVVLVGLGAFFYPMRVVPREKYRAVFTGLAVAVGALSVVAVLLLVLRRFFEREDQQDKS